MGRLSLFIIYFDRFKDSDVNYWLSFIYGLRMDTIALFAFVLIPILLYSVNLFRLSAIALAIASLVLIYLEISNIFFFEEFQTRLNYIFLEYLDHPEVVASMLWKSY